MFRRILRRAMRTEMPRHGPRVFGIGAPKTGTHSLVTMFSPYIAASHERDAQPLIKAILKRETSSDAEPVRALLRSRDKWSPLKLDASHVNIYLSDDIMALFPDSRFILTYRHPLEWLRSMTDHSLQRAASPLWERFRDFRFGPKASTTEEQPFVDAGLYSLRGYLAYWRDAIDRPRKHIPADRIMLVRTQDLHSRSGELAAFCGIANFRPDEERAHAFKSAQRHGAVSRLDPAYLAATTEAVCGDVLRELYPDRTTSDVVARMAELDA